MMSLASKLKKKSQPSLFSPPPHLVVEAYAGSGKTFTQIMGVAWAFAPDIWREIVSEIAIRGGHDPDTFQIVPSPEQQAVWDSLALSRGQVRTVTYCAFNKSIVTEFGEQWGWLVKMLATQGVTLQFATVNSLGAKVCNAAYGRIEYVDWHTENLVGRHLRRDPREIKRNPSDALMLKAVCDIVGLCKLTMVGWTQEVGFDTDSITDDDLDDLCRHFEIELNGQRNRVYSLVPLILNMSCFPDTNKSMDFNDQNWLPLVNELPVTQVDLLMVDESQDLPRAKQEFVRKMGRRIVVVGDRSQAIYGFAGADVDSIPRMTKLLSHDEQGCYLLRLTETRRCGKAIVREAQAIVPDFTAHESNCEGKVSYLTLEEKPCKHCRGTGHEPYNNPHTGTTEYGSNELCQNCDICYGFGNTGYTNRVIDGDMVLCRVNAPLVSQALRMIKSGRKAVIRGRDFGGQLITFVRKQDAQDVVHLMTKVSEYTRLETQKENAKHNPSDMRLMSIQDRQDCVEAFADGAMTVAEVVERMELMFAGKVCTGCGKHYVETTEMCKGCQRRLVRPEGVIFSSIHRAKGLEADRVFCLDLKGCTIPHPMAKTEWSKQQEWNCRYIELTRAIQELVYVTDDLE